MINDQVGNNYNIKYIRNEMWSCDQPVYAFSKQVRRQLKFWLGSKVYLLLDNQSKSRKQRNSRSRANIMHMFAVWFAKKVTSVLWSMVKMHEFREPIKALMQQKIKPKLTRIYLTRQPYKELLMISLLFYLLQVDYVPRPGWGTRATTLRLVGRYITTEYRQCVVH